MKLNTLGMIFILAAPSGGGKSSLTRALCQKMMNLTVSVSHTTREQRPGENEAEHYFFVDNNTFDNMVEAGEFIEHATVFGAQYGTSKRQLMEKLEQGIDIILDIDWQGAKQVVDIFQHVCSVFILPPSYKVLQQRLVDRGQDDASIVRSRMQKAQAEMSHYPQFDYVVINDDFNVALSDLYTIIHSARLKTTRQSIKYKALLSNLLKDQ